jgi:hypothetical protein
MHKNKVFITKLKFLYFGSNALILIPTLTQEHFRTFLNHKKSMIEHLDSS